MRFTYDDRADALYALLREDAPVARSIVIDDDRVLDVDERGEPVGIEVLGASKGVRLTDLVDRFGLGEYRESLRNLEADRFHSAELV